MCSSDLRLRIKLMAQGYEEDIVIGMEREELIATYAELLASGKLKVSPGAVGGFGYYPEVEKERLAFQQRKWEAEMELRKQETEERRQREERDAIERRQREEREEERRREEADERMRKSLLEAEQVELRKRELEPQIMRDRTEVERKDSAVAKGKLFGDAMRASAIRMGLTQSN